MISGTVPTLPWGSSQSGSILTTVKSADKQCRTETSVSRHREYGGTPLRSLRKAEAWHGGTQNLRKRRAGIELASVGRHHFSFNRRPSR